MKVFHCDHCGQLLFFENVNCVRCGRALAYVPELADMTSLDPIGGGLWSSPREPGRSFRLCENYSKHMVCNWALPAEDPHSLCRSCRLTRTIPNLASRENVTRWYKLEAAKRRLVHTLDQLSLPLRSKFEDQERGLSFEFLEDPAPGLGAPLVMTGHDGGVITVNVAEADDAERVRRRVQLDEPYRTLLGHFRHESGHYYWDRLVRDAGRVDAFRERFGDERDDYGAALARYYEQGPPPNWQARHVSAYAAMHPWEDWAETWAHYLHMTDTLETAAACGISIEPRRRDEPTLKEVPDPVNDQSVPFERMLESWAVITYVLNNLNRGLGNDDAYPFVLSPVSVTKLEFVHETIASLATCTSSALERGMR